MAVNYMQVDPFRRELEQLINRHSKENGSNTPDFQLAAYLVGCLELFDQTVRFREGWYGRDPNEFPPRGLSMPEPQVVIADIPARGNTTMPVVQNTWSS